MRVAIVAIATGASSCAPTPRTTLSMDDCVHSLRHVDSATPGAVRIMVRARNRMTEAFEPLLMCAAVDRRWIPIERHGTGREPFFADHTLDFAATVDPGAAHMFYVVASFGDHVRQGYRYEVASAHRLDPAELRDGRLEITFLELPAERLEEHPTIEWSRLIPVASGSDKSLTIVGDAGDQ